MQTTEPTVDESNLRALGVAADASAGEEFSESPAETVTSEPSESTEGDGQSPAGEDASKAESPETGTDKPNKEEPAKELSEYEKAKAAGREREAKAWQKIEEAKAEVARKAEELAKREQNTAPAKPDEYRDKDGWSAKDYDAAQKEAEAAGDDELANAAAKRAAEIRHEAQQAAQTAVARDWKGNLEKAVEANPALADLKNQESPLAKEFMDFLKTSPVFGLHPSGASIAAELFAARRQAGSVSGLEAKIEALTKENTRLTKLTSIGGSKPTKQAGQSSDDLSGAELRRMAEAADMSFAG